MDQMNNTQENSIKKSSHLTPYLSSLEAWALAFGCSVGWGAFIMPGTTFLPFSGTIGTILGMLIGAVIMIAIGMNYHYMMNRMTDAGGAFTFSKKIFGYDHGFLCAWFLGLTYLALVWANATALVLVARYTVGDLFQFGFHYQLAGYDIYLGEALLSIAAILLTGFFCMYGKRLAGKLQALLAIALLSGICVCFGAAIVHNPGGAQWFEPAFAPNWTPVMQVFRIIALVPWAFVGYESISHSAGEFRFSVKKSFRIMALAVVAIAFAYIFLLCMTVLALPEGYGNWLSYLSNLDSLQGIQAMPSFSAAQQAMGNKGIAVLGATMLCALFTSLIGNTIAASRLFYAMSEDAILPAWFGRLDRDGTPRNAILFIVGVSLLIPFFGRTAIGWHVDVSTIGATIAYGYTSAAAFKLAKENGNALARFTGAAGVVMSVLFTLFLMIPDYPAGSTLSAESYFIFAAWSILGFLFFHNIFKQDEQRRFGESTVVWLALLSLIFFTSLMWEHEADHATMQNAVTHISEYYKSATGVEGESHIRREQEPFYINGQMEAIHHSLMFNSLIQVGMIIFSLILMFNVYSIIQKRQKQIEVEKVQAEKNSRAKSEFLSNMSHDIRTPMNAIIGFTELARAENTTEAERDDYLEKIASSSQHLLALINDVLEMSRIESGKIEMDNAANNLLRIMDELRDMFTVQMREKKIHFSLLCETVTNPTVICDKNRLSRVLLNLVSNAYKFTPEGGHVSVTLRQNGTDETGNGLYEIHVKDDGIGMSPEFAERVFEAFERERTSTVSGIQGTGLGMAITKSIVDMMHGTITVATEQGKGTEFTILVPFAIAAEAEAQEQKQESDDKADVDFAGKRLLLVEDIEINRQIAVMLLTNMQFEVETAENGKEAVEKIAASSPGYFDAVLMDIQMPVMNGHEASRAIRKLPDPSLAKTPIIALTANAFQEDIQKAEEAGMDAHVAKPIDPATLAKTLAEILAQKKR